MDREELKNKLDAFYKRCDARGMPLEDLCIDEAYPGVASSSYIIRVKASWVDKMNCSDALDFLFDTLWETTDELTREKVFAIYVMNSQDELHCAQENVSLTPHK